jgi:hypothetical protein
MRWGVKRCPFSRRVSWQLIAGGHYNNKAKLLQQVANAIRSVPVIASPDLSGRSNLAKFRFASRLLSGLAF